MFALELAVAALRSDNQNARDEGGRLLAERVGVATHYPFLDRSLAFARLSPRRSYAITCRIAGPAPPGIHISGDSPDRPTPAGPVGGGLWKT